MIYFALFEQQQWFVSCALITRNGERFHASLYFDLLAVVWPLFAVIRRLGKVGRLVEFNASYVMRGGVNFQHLGRIRVTSKRGRNVRFESALALSV